MCQNFKIVIFVRDDISMISDQALRWPRHGDNNGSRRPISSQSGIMGF